MGTAMMEPTNGMVFPSTSTVISSTVTEVIVRATTASDHLHIIPLEYNRRSSGPAVSNSRLNRREYSYPNVSEQFRMHITTKHLEERHCLQVE
jgi:hypothetical protein